MAESQKATSDSCARAVTLTFEEFDYPNPAFKWVSIRLDGQEIGRCNKTPAGLVPIGKRKPVAPDELAEALIHGTLADARARKKAALADEARALALLQRVRAAGQRPRAGSKPSTTRKAPT